MNSWFAEYWQAASNLIFKTPTLVDASNSSQETIGAEADLRDAINKTITEESQKIASTQVAARKVFDTNELLVMILAELPAKDLLAFQRISRTFRETIKGHTCLQQSIFERQIPQMNNTSIQMQDLVLNPIIQSMLQPWQCLCFQVGPLLLQLGNLDPIKVPASVITAEANERTALESTVRINKRVQIETLRARICKPGSWRGMYLSQPPCKTILEVRGRPDVQKKIYEFDAATLGEMLDVVAKEVPEVDHYF